MAKIVGVHGISQEYRGENTIASEWLPALKDGLLRADYTLETDTDFVCAFYGDLFRGKNVKAFGHELPNYDSRDVASGLEEDLMVAWWKALAEIDDETLKPEDLDTKKVWAPTPVQQALSALSKSKCFGGIAEKAVIFMIKQVGAYLQNSGIRQDILERIETCVQNNNPTVLVGHSLGSIACYESLCAHPEWPIKVFVSLGSPLGINRLIFDKLQPQPVDGMGVWPGSIETWVNIADKGDIVALTKSLDPMFDGTIVDQLVDNGFGAHNASRYLTTQEVGEAIKLGL